MWCLPPALTPAREESIQGRLRWRSACEIGFGENVTVKADASHDQPSTRRRFWTLLVWNSAASLGFGGVLLALGLTLSTVLPFVGLLLFMGVVLAAYNAHVRMR